MNGDLHQLHDLIRKATAAITGDYFLPPVAAATGEPPLLIYRERVYAYELYHQLRDRWPRWPYSLAGEVDKRGHPIVRGPDLDNVKPDLLIHIPGKMENLAVIEIKPLAAQGERIEDDLKKLIAFRQQANYKAAILLAFGENEIERVVARAQALRRNDTSLVEIYHHRRAGESAEMVFPQG
ncbi:MAG: hypothetical protein HY521_11065 [Proteobacteria bacterium]|nr:hypothetical protein [Pseudomonadota bacterium]